MRCPRCDVENRSAAKFCAECGAALGPVCPACGHVNLVGARFCNDCGTRLAVSATKPPAAYTPAHLAGRILTSRAALEGERKQVTVLFADTCGSLELVAGRDPEEARALLDAVIEHLMEAVHHYEGTVNQVAGDGIMAIFGAPIAHEDHAVRACHAGLRMRDAIARDAARFREVCGADVAIRVGLNSGEVVVRSIGSDLHMDYSAIGETTHLASRMEQSAEPGTILATAATARLAEGYVRTEPLGPLAVKGMSAPVEAFRIVAAGPAQSRLDVAAARGLSRFVGREMELAELRRASASAESGRGQVVAIVGEPGVGKSRLVREFVRSPALARWLVLEGNAAPYGRRTAYLPIVGLLRRYFDIAADDDAESAGGKVEARLSADHEPPRYVVPLLALLDVPVSDAHWDALDPPQRRQRTLDAIKRVLLRRAQEAPTCLVIEDLHWIDAESEAVLGTLIDSAATARLLIVVTYRPEYRHAWTGKSYYAQLHVDPLPRERSLELLRDLLGEHAAPPPLVDELIARTEGNPFFLEETVRHLAEAGVLVGRRGDYRVRRATEAIELPATVHSVLAARIDRLPAEDKRVLQMAAVIGKDVPEPLLVSVADAGMADPGEALRRLQGAEFLYEIRLFPQAEYTFKHALTLEVAYGTLLREQRRALDARIVEALEQMSAAPGAEQIDRLARHALRAELWDKAVAYAREAGARAAGRSAHRTAVAYFEQALEALHHLPETREHIEQAIDVRLDLRYSLSPLAEFGRIEQHLSDAETLAESIEDLRRLGLARCFLCNYFTITYDLDRAVDYGQRALRLAAAVADVPLRVVTTAFLVAAHYTRGDYGRAAETGRQNVEVLRGDRETERFGMALLPAVYSRTMLALSLAELGRFGEAEKIADEGLAIAKASNHAYSVISAHLGAGVLQLRRGEFAAAIHTLERARAICRSAEVPVAFASVAASLASAYAQSGAATEAISVLEEGIDRAIAVGDRLGFWLKTAGLAEAYVAAGWPDKARPLAERAVAITQAAKTRGTEAVAHLVLAESLLPLDLAAAERHEREALTIAERLGMRPLAARCRLALGLVYARTGRHEDATRELTASVEAFRAMGMTAWAERASAALGEATT